MRPPPLMHVEKLKVSDWYIDEADPIKEGCALNLGRKACGSWTVDHNFGEKIQIKRRMLTHVTDMTHIFSVY